LKEARLAFECGIACLAAEGASQSGLFRLDGILGEGRSAISRRAEFVMLDGEFHAGVAELTGNPLFLAVSRASSPGVRNIIAPAYICQDARRER
jgi:GntR family transcriptional regulator, sialic acid-inducible nan operon repressor